MAEISVPRAGRQHERIIAKRRAVIEGELTSLPVDGLDGSEQGRDIEAPAQELPRHAAALGRPVEAVVSGLPFANFPVALRREIVQAAYESLVPGGVFSGYGYAPFFVEGDEPMAVHRQMADTLDRVFDEIAAIQSAARSTRGTARPCWPMIVLRTPKGWTGPKVVDGQQIEGTARSHQVPLANPRGNITVEMWLAPSLQYLPAKIRIVMGDEAWLDLMVDHIEQR